MDKPDVDQIEGLSPAISIDQKGTSRNPRSTVGTVTEIYDYLRLLYARVGQPHCPECGREVNQQTAQQIVDAILEKPAGSRVMILAPLIKDRKGQHKAVFDDIRKMGYVRVRVNGEIRDVDEEIELDRYKMHTIEAVVDRLIIGNGYESGDGTDVGRLTNSVETALKLGDGMLMVTDVTESEKPWDRLFSEHFACVHCGTNLPEIEPRTFSFNSPHGACPACTGLGMRLEVDPDLIFSQPELTLEGGAIRPWARRSSSQGDGYYNQLIRSVARHYGIPLDVPAKKLSAKQRDIIFYGSKQGDRITLRYHNAEGMERVYETTYEGVIPNLQRRYKESTSDYVRSEIERYMSARPCPVCHGKRLRPEALAVTVVDKSIDQVTSMSVAEAIDWVQLLRGQEEETPLSTRDQTIAFQVLKEIHDRLSFMVNVGLDYLTLDRAAGTLSGGEAQRIRLATQIGSQLMGCLYILDEPSIGLHQRDNARLIATLEGMRDLGNTVLVVEHDADTMHSADWILDLGPGAGEHGGQVVCSAPYDDFLSLRGVVNGPVSARRAGDPHPRSPAVWQRKRIGCARGQGKQSETHRRALPAGQVHLCNRSEWQWKKQPDHRSALQAAGPVDVSGQG